MTDRQTEKEPIAARNRRDTEKRLLAAIKEIQGSKGKLTISLVAKHAGVSPALIHNTYPDVAEAIRALVGKETRRQRTVAQEAAAAEKRRNRLLRAENLELRQDMAKLASVNLTLLSKIAVLQEALQGKVIPFPCDYKHLGGAS